MAGGIHQNLRNTSAVCTQLISLTDEELLSLGTLPILPEEIILQILLILPVRSLLQFRCGCKSWKTLISDPQFAKTHLQGSTDESIMTNQRLVSFINTEPYEVISYPVKTLFENPSIPIEPDSFSLKYEYHIMGSCNGLLCLYDTSQRRVRLCNPATRLVSKISPATGYIYRLICNYGFGYDQVNDKYKVLISVRTKDINVTKIYTFGEDCWKTIQNFPINSHDCHEQLGQFVSGTLNWLADKRGVSSKQCVILSLDLEKESCGEMLLPQIDVGYMARPLLYVLNNCLCVFFETSETHWTAWLMKEYGVVKSWTKLMIIPHEKFILNQESFNDPLFVSENGIILLVDGRSYKLSLYNFNSSESDFDYPLISTKLGIDRRIYRESLISPHR